jgi:heme-degrading monooxygenase HmoA
MHIRMTLTDGATDIDSATAHLRDEVLPKLKGQNGFRGMTASADRQAGVLAVVTSWETEADLKASEAAASQVRDSAVDAIGGRLVEVRAYEEMVNEVGQNPPAPGCLLVVTPVRMEPANVAANVAFFRETVLPEIKALPGFRAVRNMVDRETGEAMVGVVLTDEAAVEMWMAGAEQRRRRASGQGIELGPPARREVVFAALG